MVCGHETMDLLSEPQSSSMGVHTWLEANHARWDLESLSWSIRASEEDAGQTSAPAVKSSTGLQKWPSWPVTPTDPNTLKAVSLR